MPNTVRLNDQDPTILASDALYRRALGLIPGQSQTLAKSPGQFVNGVAPKFLARGKGSHVWDVDGNEYIDLQMAVGPLSLGYGYEATDRAIRDQLDQGITFSLMHPLEVEVAELVRAMVPGVEMVRFGKNGCDVTTAAVRLARAHTCKDKVLSCGYHGWHDWYVAVTDRSAGVPNAVAALTGTFDYNDIESLEDAIDDDTACVILEPVTFDLPRDGFLQKVREVCSRRGVVLVFDEMWTGFRLANGGAQEHFDVKADLVCFSKAVANGMPLSILAGRADLLRPLEKNVFWYSTFGGEALSLAAAKATLEEMRAKNVVGHIAQIGRSLKDGYNAAATELGLETRAIGPDCRSLITFDAKAGDPLLQKSIVQQELVRAGVLWSGFNTPSFSHSKEDVAHVLVAYRHALGILQRAISDHALRETLRGQPVEPSFRKTTGFNTKPGRAR